MLNDNEPKRPKSDLFTQVSEIAGSRLYPLSMGSLALSFVPLTLERWLGIVHPALTAAGGVCLLVAIVLAAVGAYRAYLGGGRGDRD